MGLKDKLSSIIITFIVVIVIAATIIINFLPTISNSNSSDIFILSEGWQYSINDNKTYDIRKNESLQETFKSASWVDVNLKNLPNDILECNTLNKYNPILIRVKLSNFEIGDPIVLFTTCGYNFDVYYDDKKIYSFGDMASPFQRKVGVFQHLVKIPDFKAGKYLYFRIYPYFSYPYGINGFFGKIEMNSSDGYINVALSERDDSVKFFGSSFIFIGIISIVIFILTRMKEKMAFSFGIFSFCAGLFMISYNQTVYSFYINPFFLYYMLFISYYLLPVGACLFIKDMFEVGIKKIYNSIIFIFLVHIILMLLLDIFNIAPMSLTNSFFDYLFIIAILYNIFIILRAGIRKNVEARIMTIAISIAAFLGIYDIWRALSNIVWQRQYRYNHQWGFMLVVLAIGYLIVRRFIQSHESLKKYSEEIEKWNKLLEKRVDERTEELISKNRQLTCINSRLDELNKEKEFDNKKLKETLKELEETQKQLVQSEKMVALGGMVAGIAHEINTPVGVGVTAVSYLEQKTIEIMNTYKNNELTQEEFEIYLDLCKETSNIILTDLQKASELIRSFKQVAVDQSTEEKRDFKTKEYIEHIILSLKPKLKNTKHNIIVDCEEGLHILSYPGAFSQILTNLVMNTLIHAFDEGQIGSINISVRNDAERIILKYSDDGKGISKSNLNRIFDPFFTTKLGNGGTGLGLNIVYNIVTQTFGGSIFCESEINKGATFIIEFSI